MVDDEKKILERIPRILQLRRVEMNGKNIVLHEISVDARNCYRIGLSRFGNEWCFHIWPFFQDNNGQWRANRISQTKHGISKSIKFLDEIITGLLKVRDSLVKLRAQEEKMAA